MKPSDAQWRELFKAQKKQGLGVKKFCARNNISYACWYQARKRLLTQDYAVISCEKPIETSFCLKLEQQGKTLEVSGPIQLLPAIGSLLGSLS